MGTTECQTEAVWVILVAAECTEVGVAGLERWAVGNLV